MQPSKSLANSPGRIRGSVTSIRRAGGSVVAKVLPPWWVHPGVFLALIILPIAIAVCLSNNYLIAFNRADYFSPIFFSWYYASLFLGGLLTLTCFAFIGARPGPLADQVGFRDGALDFLFFICMAGYVIWFGPLLISSPQVLLGAMTGESGAVYDVREMAPTLPGVTTVTQFAIAYICIYGIKRFIQGERLAPRYDLYMMIMLGAAFLRAMANSERIAVIELLFCLLVIMCSSRFMAAGPARRIVRRTLPLLLLGIGPVFFAAFEYNRSWINYYQYEYDSLWAFALERFGLYYVTALNNFCGFLDYTSWPTFTGEWTMRWLYHFPLIGDLLGQLVGADADKAFEGFLKEYADNEFNNPTGVLPVYHDWGIFGGIIFFAMYGLFAGLAYRSFRQSRGFLQYVYPLVLYSLFEILRIGYISDGRSVAALIGLAIAYMGWGYRVRTRRTTPAGGRPETPVLSPKAA